MVVALEMRPKSAQSVFFFCHHGTGEGEPMLTMGLCDRSPARGVRSTGRGDQPKW